eukprot:12229052-Heterocapsa_arctica.AAC.1
MDHRVVFQCPGLGADFELKMREGGELVRTGRRSTAEWDQDLASGGRAVVRALEANGLCGYMVSPQGARKLLETCFPIEDQID